MPTAVNTESSENTRSMAMICISTVESDEKTFLLVELWAGSS